MSNSVPASEVPPLLDERILADLHEDFASTGDLAHLAHLMRGYVERGVEQLAAVAAAIDGGDREAIRTTAHRLKGSSRTLGASLTGAVAAKIEAAGDRGDVAEARRALPELEVVFSLSRSALGDMIDVLDGGGEPPEDPAERADCLRALLVDDEPIALAVLRAAVERLGHDCAIATTGEAALAEYERERPDVVLTDFHMPGFGGMELAARIRAAGDRSTYIAVLSASGGRAEGAIGATIDAALSKPIREDELRAVLGLAARRAAA